jgi:membrane peptidoglycan carboxypeptidase
MTLRGQLTLAGLILGAAGLLSLAVRAFRDAEPALRAPVAAVAQAPPAPTTPEPAPPARPEAPESVLARVPVTRAELRAARAVPVHANGGGAIAAAAGHLADLVPAPPEAGGIPGPLRVEYTLHPELSERVHEALANAKVALGHVIVLDPETGHLLAYASTDVKRFPPGRVYPAASLIKVVTAAAALDRDPAVEGRMCRFDGSPYRLTPSRVDPPRRGGRTVSLEKALASSNNQCFAQLAVHTVGGLHMLEAIRRFGLLEVPAPGHAAGAVDGGSDTYALGKLGSGLNGTWITPLHAAALAGTLADGVRVEPRWIDRVTDAEDHELALPPAKPAQRVLTPELARTLRSMLVSTTTKGTARRAYRDRRGRPLLGMIRVAGKTGSLSGHDPDGRYEWFAGVAPATDPRVAVAVVVVQQGKWWRSASQVSAEVFRQIFCPDGRCDVAAVEQWLGEPSSSS